MDTDFVLSQSDRSPRVRRVHSAAIRYVLAYCCSHQVDEKESEDLSKGHTPKSALESVVQQRKTRRHGFTELFRKKTETYLVIADGIQRRHGTSVDTSGVKPDTKGRLDRYRRQIQREALKHAYEKSVELTDNHLSQYKSMYCKYERLDKLRTFMRRTDRLLHRQQSKLRVGIYAADAYAKAEARLVQCCLQAIRRAVTVAYESEQGESQRFR